MDGFAVSGRYHGAQTTPSCVSDLGAGPGHDQEDHDRMAKVRSSIRSVARTGRSRGIRITDRDRARIAFMGRWYCSSVEHLVRAEYDPALWRPTHPEYGTEESRDAARRAFHNIHHRLNQLRRIESDPARHVGPLVEADMSHTGRTAWFTTRIGARSAHLPWTMRNSINPMFAAHSWMAADIGTAIEARGYNVLSEKELATGIDRHGFRIEAPLESSFIGKAGQETKKKPDVAVLHPNGQDYIAIEVERATDRSVKAYEEKLRAYRRNPAVKAVWYVCASETTAKRVAAGAQKALGSGSRFPLRIHTNIARDGYHFFDMDNLHSLFRSDLDLMQPAMEGSA